MDFKKCSKYHCYKAREIFEEFDGPSVMKKDEHGNYINTYIHNIYVGFRRWYQDNECFKCENLNNKYELE